MLLIRSILIMALFFQEEQVLSFCPKSQQEETGLLVYHQRFSARSSSRIKTKLTPNITVEVRVVTNADRLFVYFKEIDRVRHRDYCVKRPQLYLNLA